MSFTPRKFVHRARALRKEQTEAEKRLWGCLRARRLNQYKFIRQQPIGPFIADFICRERKLVVEVDGATHSTEHEIEYDRRRTAYLAARGFQVLRIQNCDVFRTRDDVFDMILTALEGRLEPD